MVTLVNRAKMTTATTGTGTITLGTAEAGYQTFADAGVVDTDVVRYVIEDGTDWEIGTGTYTASGTTLTRTVSESSNADAALNLTGSAAVYVSATAEDIPAAYTNTDVDTHLNTGTAASGEVLSWTGTDYDWITAGGGSALELYAENPVTPVVPSATGTNAVAIGIGATASGAASFAVNGTASQSNGVAIHGTVTGLHSSAIGRNSLGIPAVASPADGAMALNGSYAGGTDSFAAAIGNNTSSYGATGANSVAIGDLAKATTSDSVCIANASTVSGSGAAVLGGRSNTASASASLVLGGDSNVANSQRSVAYGYYGNTNGILGKVAHGIGPSRQNGMYGLAIDTADATPKQLVTDYFFAGSATNQVILPNNSAYAFHGTIVARQKASAGTACAAWKVEGLIRREGSAGTTVLVNSATTVLDNTPAWGMALSADTTNGGLKVEVTGVAATNIRFVATISTSEVTY